MLAAMVPQLVHIVADCPVARAGDASNTTLKELEQVSEACRTRVSETISKKVAYLTSLNRRLERLENDLRKTRERHTLTTTTD